MIVSAAANTARAKLTTMTRLPAVYDQVITFFNFTSTKAKRFKWLSIFKFQVSEISYINIKSER